MGEEQATVVVGWDCTPASVRALHWAASTVARGGRLVCVTVEPGVPPPALYASVPCVPFGERSLANAVEAISSLASSPGAGALRTIPDTECIGVSGDVALGLETVARARAAGLVVIGAPSSRPRWWRRPLSDRLLAGLPCPLVVVP